VAGRRPQALIVTAQSASISSRIFERVDVDSLELKAVAVWNTTTDQGVNRSDAVSDWLRR